jgi:PleD family two-component response regulator
MPAEETRTDGSLSASDERPESQSRILVVDDHEDNIEVLKVRL